MDRKLIETRNAYTSNPSRESAEALAALLDRAGEREEAFSVRLEGLRADRDLAQLHYDRLKDEAKAKAHRLANDYLEDCQAPYICPHCLSHSGMKKVPRHAQRWGDGDDWRANEPYPCPKCNPQERGAWDGKAFLKDSNGKIVKDRPYLHPFRQVRERLPEVVEEARQDVNLVMGPRIEEAQDVLREAKEALTPYNEALAIRKGALLKLNNKRARPKFAEGRNGEKAPRAGQRVPHGTQGFVFWIGDTVEHRSAYGTWSYGESTKVGLRTASGEVFFTYLRNLSKEALNPAQRLAGEDPESQRQEAEAKAKEEQEAKVAEAFPNGFPRGTKVLYEGQVLKVFWSGERRGQLRLGLRRRISDRNEAPVWIPATEAVPA